MCEICFEAKVSRAVETRMVDEVNTINNLREEIRHLKEANDEARRQLALLKLPVNYGKCLLQKMISPEIRNRIYKLLLVNPQLGESYWIDESVNFGASFKYGLSPALLQTCKWIYQEASPILYGIANTFIIMCPGKTTIPRSPLTRYLDLGQLRFDFTNVVALTKIRSWRIITSVKEHQKYSFLLVQYCRGISKTPLASLELVVVFPKVRKSQDDHNQRVFGQVMKTASILRSIRALRIRTAKPEDLHVHMIKQWKPYFGEGLFEYPKLVKWDRLLRGNSPVENLHEMRTRLLSYAQSFERNESLRADMDSEDFSVHNPSGAGEYTMEHRNPFLMTSDSLEAALHRTTAAVYLQDSKKFNSSRKIVLAELEPQYQRIQKGYNSMRALVRDIVADFTCFEFVQEDYSERLEWFEEAYRVVEKAAGSFHRKLSPSAGLLVRQRPICAPSYDHLDRERAIVKLNKLLESFLSTGEDGDEYVEDFVELFKFVVTDMEKQYCSMRAARMALLDDDPSKNKSDCDIDLAVDPDEEIIHWERESDTDLMEAEFA